jgi:hypothetical protein
MAVEPWPGYKDMSKTRRKALMEFKIDEARLRWDLPHAQLIAAAVANYEALERTGKRATVIEKAALGYIDKIKKTGDAGFSGEAGGWGHGIGDEAGGWGHG